MPSASRTGYTFNGWTNSGTCGSMSGTTYTFPSNSGTTCTKTAGWTEKSYTITYNANGGSGGPGSQTVKYSQQSATPSSKPTRSGYTFSQWCTNSNGTGSCYCATTQNPCIFKQANAEPSFTTLYAKWTKN